ncbi:MAG: GTPase ObgE [Rhodothermales bacterium]|nr:GTPase ObgE [Rhodothermales bacterium]
MKFVDYVTITVRSGKGGAGSASFRRAKFEPRGGPDGGDGGKGGSVSLKADKHLYTLLDLRYNRHHFAGDGQAGSGNNRKGGDGEDIVLRVPPGTVARDSDTDEVLGELLVDGDELLLAKGGSGGKGNTFFKSSTNQAPKHAQGGEPGEERNVTLELKLLADVGLVGFPNAGKSTLVSSMSAAKPKIADYPFTTLEPSLGVVQVEGYQSFVMADIPGIIEGAHEGKGLGIQFLKHIERNAVLLLVISVEEMEIREIYDTLMEELVSFNAELASKPRMLALTKMDLMPEDVRDEAADEVRRALPDDIEVIPVSAVARFGLTDLKRRLWQVIENNREAMAGAG